MKKTLLALTLTSLFGLAACSDHSILADNKNSDGTVESTDVLASMYTGPGEDYNPQVDPNKPFSLYKITSKKFGGGCIKVTFMEDQMTRAECDVIAQANTQKDDVAAQEPLPSKEELEAKGYDGAAVKMNRRFDNPSQMANPANYGITANWRYACLSETTYTKWSEKNADDICK